MSKIRIVCRTYRDFFQWIFTLDILHAIDNRFFVIEGDVLMESVPRLDEENFRENSSNENTRKKHDANVFPKYCIVV